MNDHTKLIEQFYTAFAKKDYATMQSLYHDSAAFSDSVFQNLNAKETKAMWHMLVTAPGAELVVKFDSIKVNGNTGICNWYADYIFSGTGRPVHNVIKANFEFKDGKIITHTDDFDLHKWSGMALGFKGKLLGWTSFMQKKIRAMAKGKLNKFISENNYA